LRVIIGNRYAGRILTLRSSVIRAPYLLSSFLINKKPLFPCNADFNQISSVWAKFRYSGKISAV
jgi:hypothetical protein